MKTIAEMTPREIDVQVAHRVMGWKSYLMEYRGPTRCERKTTGFLSPDDAAGFLKANDWILTEQSEIDDTDFSGLPYFTVEVYPDYTVLKRVRETWGDRQRLFQSAINTLWFDRHIGGDLSPVPLIYRPGDYSRAALAALESEGVS